LAWLKLINKGLPNQFSCLSRQGQQIRTQRSLVVFSNNQSSPFVFLGIIFWKKEKTWIWTLLQESHISIFPSWIPWFLLIVSVGWLENDPDYLVASVVGDVDVLLPTNCGSIGPWAWDWISHQSPTGCPPLRNCPSHLCHPCSLSHHLSRISSTSNRYMGNKLLITKEIIPNSTKSTSAENQFCPHLF